MFIKTFIAFFLLQAWIINAAAIYDRKQDNATTTLQFNKLKDSGLLDNMDKDHLVDQIKGMKANTVIAKIVTTNKFKQLKTAADKKNKKNSKAKQTNAQKMQATGLLNKLKEFPGKNLQAKLDKMSAQTLLVKIAQSQAFKEAVFQAKADKKAQDAKTKADQKAGKKPTVVKIIQSDKGVPTATIMSIKGGPAITLAKVGPKTTFAGKVYTAKPTATFTSSTAAAKDNSASGLTFLSGSLISKLVAVGGGAFAGALLVL